MTCAVGGGGVAIATAPAKSSTTSMLYHESLVLALIWYSQRMAGGRGAAIG